VPDPKKNATLPPWQKYLSKYDVDGNGITSGKEISFAFKSAANELFSKGKNVVSSMADGSMQGPGGGQPDGETTPGEYAMLAASFIGPGGFTKGGIKGLISKGRNFFTKNTSKNITKAKSIVKPPYVPKELPNYGDMRGVNMGKLDNADFSKGGPVDKVLAATRSKGAIYDANLSGNFNWKPNMFRKMPDVGGRKMVDVNPGGGVPSQRFYESTSLGNKKLLDGSSSKGTWVPLEGYGRSTDSKSWFIKGRASHEGSVIGPGWDEAYGSKVFKNMGTNIKKMGY
jgi:hypothetical protein|tara:strand:+ start:2564 stop:3415 length:852 start_codon:yes stop_codon:yes gene_type:complete